MKQARLTGKYPPLAPETLPATIVNLVAKGRE
jgi:hypothetical protein